MFRNEFVRVGMEANSKSVMSITPDILNYWVNLPLEDVSSLRLSQRIEHFNEDARKLLESFQLENSLPSIQYLRFVWSISLRDFNLLLRDSLLALVKHEQLTADGKKTDEGYNQKIQELLIGASKSVHSEFEDNSSSAQKKVWSHQESPVVEILSQLVELEIQCKKIFRSSTKIDDIRFNINEYVKDFLLQFSRQNSAVERLFSIVYEVKSATEKIKEGDSNKKIESVADFIGDKSLILEQIQGTESIDILPYVNNETLSIPVSTMEGSLVFKSVNIKSEFARWFSSYIYPKMVELESKRDHAIEKCLLAFTQLRTKISAISLAESIETNDLQKDFTDIFNQLQKDVLDALVAEVEETNDFVEKHQKEYLLASNIYDEEVLFLPDSASNQISNLGKDAQKRISSRLNSYQNQFKNYFNKLLSRYIEVDKTPYAQFIRNLTTINDDDDSLALFLKNGYLGKSFTVPRPEMLDAIIQDYALWLEGFNGSILLSGNTGIGKSTLLGMVNHLGLAEEIIQLKEGESYFIEHKSYPPILDFKLLIEDIIRKTKGRRTIVCIDDLGSWHDDELALYDNINKLFRAISRYRNRIFFVVTCSSILEERLSAFKDLDAVFSARKKIEKMNSNKITEALNLRARVNDLSLEEEPDLDSKIAQVVRDSRGNIGQAMMEFCRYSNPSYRPHMKSQEFKRLILRNKTILKFICSYHHCSINLMSKSLSEMDFRETMKAIDYMVSQKILNRPKKGSVSINPSVIHIVEKILVNN